MLRVRRATPMCSQTRLSSPHLNGFVLAGRRARQICRSGSMWRTSCCQPQRSSEGTHMTAIAGWLHGSFASEVEINELKINIVLPVCTIFSGKYYPEKKTTLRLNSQHLLRLHNCNSKKYFKQV